MNNWSVDKNAMTHNWKRGRDKQTGRLHEQAELLINVIGGRRKAGRGRAGRGRSIVLLPRGNFAQRPRQFNSAWWILPSGSLCHTPSCQASVWVLVHIPLSVCVYLGSVLMASFFLPHPSNYLSLYLSLCLLSIYWRFTVYCFPVSPSVSYSLVPVCKFL